MIDSKYVDGLISSYRITSEIAGRLKSLFGFVAENIIQKATQVLNTFSKEDFFQIRQIKISKNETAQINEIGNNCYISHIIR